jgi:hypothetical protein
MENNVAWVTDAGQLNISVKKATLSLNNLFLEYELGQFE